MFRNVISIKTKLLISFTQTTSWMTTHYWLFATAFLVFSLHIEAVPPSPTSAHSIQWWQRPTYHSSFNLIVSSLLTADWCVVVCWSAQTHSTLRTSWATGRQPPRQVKFIPPTCKYLATVHPQKFLTITHIHLTTLYVSMLRRMNMIFRASERTPTCRYIMHVKKPTNPQHRNSLLQDI
jgi:hypothetical protein